MWLFSGQGSVGVLRELPENNLFRPRFLPNSNMKSSPGAWPPEKWSSCGKKVKLLQK